MPTNGLYVKRARFKKCAGCVGRAAQVGTPAGCILCLRKLGSALTSARCQQFAQKPISHHVSFSFPNPGNALNQAIQQQYFNPPDTNALFGLVKSPKLEEIFYKSKPRYFKRTSSAVWNSPPFSSGKSVVGLPYTFKRC